MIPFGPVSIVLKESEVTGLKKDEATRLVAANLAVVLYDAGSEKAEAFIVPPTDSEKRALSLGPAASLSSDTHSSLQTYLIIAVVIACLLLGVVVAMSRGAGRLGVPAFVVVLGTAPLAALWALAAQAIGDGDIGDNPAILTAREAARNAAGDLRTTFLSIVLVAAVSAVGALATGVGINLFRWARKPDKDAPPIQGSAPPLRSRKREPAS